METADVQGLRLDRWLWYTRFFKTRGLAAEAIGRGHARIDGERVKPARNVRIGSRLTIVKGSIEWEIVVLALPNRRGSAAEAGACYQETPESTQRRLLRADEHRAMLLLNSPPTRGRPDKRTRRLLRARNDR